MLKKYFLYLTLSCSFLLPVLSFAASFDCANSQSFADKTVCQHVALSNLDSYLNLLSSEKMDEATQLKKQGAFLTQRDACKSQQCFKHVYTQAIRNLLTPDHHSLMTSKLTGDWLLKNSDQNNVGNLSLQSLTSSGFHFNLALVFGANTRSESGDAIFLDDHNAFYRDPTQNSLACTLHFNFSVDSIVIFSSPSCDTSLGDGARFFKISATNQPHVTTLYEAGLLPTKATEIALRKLVGEEKYKLFLDSIDVVSQNQKVDQHLSFKTTFVRGIANQQAAIILINANLFWAAVLDSEHEEIDYFTNEVKSSYNLPLSIQKWIDSTQPEWLVKKHPL